MARGKATVWSKANAYARGDCKTEVIARWIFVPSQRQPVTPITATGGDHAEVTHYVSAVTRTMFVPSLRTMACFSVATVMPVPLAPMKRRLWPVPL